MDLNKEKPPTEAKNGLGTTLYSFVTVAVAYTTIGVGVGLLWAFGTAPFELPALSLLQFIALWWAWLLFVAQPILFFVNYFRATDPLAVLGRLK